MHHRTIFYVFWDCRDAYYSAVAELVKVKPFTQILLPNYDTIASRDLVPTTLLIMKRASVRLQNAMRVRCGVTFDKSGRETRSGKR